MSTETTNESVQLKSIPGTKKGAKVDASKNAKTRSFPIDQANALLKIKKSAWKLDDKNFVFNGHELAKAKK